MSEIENIGFSVNNTLEFYDIVQIAREMHKEEIKYAHFDGQCDETEGYPIVIAEHYYHETFGGDNE